MKVLIIPEDQTHDGFIAKPVIEALFEEAGIPARVAVLPEPRLRGAGDALDRDIVSSIVADNPMVDLFLLIVDRDCNRKNHVELAAQRESEHPKLIACVAVEELEVWMLALYKTELLPDPWKAVCAECDPKERWADPLLKRLGARGPGAGRKRAMRKLKGNLRSLQSLCPELAQLKKKILVAGTQAS